MLKLKHVLTVALVFFLLSVFAQGNASSEFISVLYLKNGSIFRGDILTYERGGILEMRIIGGQVLEFKEEEIERIEQEMLKSDNPAIEKSEVEEKKSKSSEWAEAYSQKPEGDYLDIVTLTNGTIFKGKIVEIKNGEYLIIRLSGGEDLQLEDEEIEGLGWEENNGDYKEEYIGPRLLEKNEEFREERRAARLEERNIYAFKEKGMFNVVYFSSTSGEQDGDFIFGLGVHNIVGYQFNRLFGLGLGLGLDSYSFESGQTVYPIYLEGRGYLTKQITAPYYAVAAGYGFAFKNRDQEITEAAGGYMFHPSVGLRFGASNDTNLMLDIGVKWQKALFVREIVFSGEREERDIVFQRLTMRLGLVF